MHVCMIEVPQHEEEEKEKLSGISVFAEHRNKMRGVKADQVERGWVIDDRHKR